MISEAYAATTLFPAIFGEFLGESEGEQGRLIADNGGNSSGGGHMVNDLAVGRLTGSAFVSAIARCFSIGVRACRT